MADERARLLAKFIEPLRVTPGSKVKLAKDFDPGYKASFLKKKEGASSPAHSTRYWPMLGSR